jgi:transposase
MEQRALIRFLTIKGTRARAITAGLEDVDHTDALGLPTVKKWRRHFAQGGTSLCDDPRSREPLTTDLAAAIASLLKEKPFILCKVLSRHFPIAKATSLRILYDDLWMKKFDLRWGPHTLDANQKAEQVVLSHELLAVPETSRPTGFQNILTGDESWFFLYYPRNSTQVHSRDR